MVDFRRPGHNVKVLSCIEHKTGPSEAGQLGRLKPPYFFTTFHKLQFYTLFIINICTCNHDSPNHVNFYNIKYMNPQLIILSIGGVAFLESIC